MSNPNAGAGHDRGVWQESSDDKHGQMTAKKIQRRLLILYAAKTAKATAFTLLLENYLLRWSFSS